MILIDLHVKLKNKLKKNCRLTSPAELWRIESLIGKEKKNYSAYNWMK